MIDINKKYKTDSGLDVRLITTTGGTDEYPVVGIISGRLYPGTWDPHGHHVSRGSMNLVEADPWDGLAIGTILEVRPADTAETQCVYYAGDGTFVLYMEDTSHPAGRESLTRVAYIRDVVADKVLKGLCDE